MPSHTYAFHNYTDQDTRRNVHENGLICGNNAYSGLATVPWSILGEPLPPPEPPKTPPGPAGAQALEHLNACESWWEHQLLSYCDPTQHNEALNPLVEPDIPAKLFSGCISGLWGSNH